MEENYFSTDENALAYIKEIRSFIETLPNLRHRTTMDTKYGNYYATYKANRRTTWYILFDVSGDRYIVRNLINNHTTDYPKFIANLK